MKIEQQEIEVQAKSECENLGNSLKEMSCRNVGHILKTSKRVTNSKKKGFKSKDLRYNLFESLILAQDERWRRA